MRPTEKVRQALRGVAAPGLSAPEIRALVNDNPNKSLRSMTKSGEVLMAGEGRKHTYYLNPEHQAERAAPEPPTRRPRKKTLKQVVRKHIAAKPAAPDMSALALDNYQAAGRQLLDAIREQVEGVDDDPVLKLALENFDRAGKLLQAAGA